ncbi:MAG: 50S ribosomal protein L9 [Candidatus Melainabacteria bacterium]|nr:50S ribosomal protein L9 [Candidatus Melainabacteria bacterium]
MQLILNRDYDALGEQGDVVNVSDGYARNYLLPQNIAIKATPGALKDLESRREQLRQKAEKKHQESLTRAETLQALGELVIEANAGEAGKLFGSITTKELSQLLLEKTGLEIERRNLSLSQPINRLGEYTLYIKISAKVSAELPLLVIALQTESTRQAAASRQAKSGVSAYAADDEAHDREVAALSSPDASYDEDAADEEEAFDLAEAIANDDSDWLAEES